MGYGTAVREARLNNGRTQDDVARSVHISDSMLSDIERGRRPAAPDTLRALTGELDDPRVYFEAGLHVTGGVGSPWLNAVDRHRMAMKAKCREELQEVLDIFDRASTILVNAQGPDDLNGEQLDKVRRMVLEMIEAKTALKNTIAEFCLIYMLSPRELYQEHRTKLLQAGYLREEKSALGGAR